MYLHDLGGKAILFLSIEKRRPFWICGWNMGYIISKTQETNFSTRTHLEDIQNHLANIKHLLYYLLYDFWWPLATLLMV